MNAEQLRQGVELIYLKDGKQQTVEVSYSAEEPAIFQFDFGMDIVWEVSRHLLIAGLWSVPVDFPIGDVEVKREGSVFAVTFVGVSWTGRKISSTLRFDVKDITDIVNASLEMVSIKDEASILSEKLETFLATL